MCYWSYRDAYLTHAATAVTWGKTSQPTAMESTKTSPLLRLPPELRDCIWHDVLTPQPSQPYRLENGHMEPALLSVSRQIRSESSGIFYGNNAFIFSDPRACVRRLTSISKDYIDLIRDLRFDTSETCADATSWRTAVQETSVLDQRRKMGNLQEELLRCGLLLQAGVLKCRVLLGSGEVWTDDPMRTALAAANYGQCNAELQ